MKILITGGAGFIGSHLCESLLADGHNVTIIDNLSTGKFSNISHLQSNSNFHYVIGSILDSVILEKLIAEADEIYHLAAAVGVKYIIQNPLLSLQTNVLGTENVLEFSNKYKKKVLIASTSEIYGKSEKIPYSEDDDRVLGSTSISRWSYSCAKAVDEFFALAYFREKKLPVIIVRLFNTVGPRQSGQYGMVIPKFVKSALLNQPILVYGTGKQTRCFADVSDVVWGLRALMDEPQAIGQVFNLGNTEEISIEDLATKIRVLVKSDSKIEYVPYENAFEDGFEDMQKRMPDLSKMKEVTGYDPKYNLDMILERVIKYYET
jgi:UDP-glucose 4-epimerase